MDINVGLTKNEKEVILKIASRKGCDKDGDIISFFVQENEGVVITHMTHIINNKEY